MGQGRRTSFLKKRSKKRLSFGSPAAQTAKSNRQKFFGAFFQKRTAFFLALTPASGVPVSGGIFDADL